MHQLLQGVQERRRAIELERVRTDADAIRERCRTFAGFFREAWHVLEPVTKLKWNWHLQAMCDTMQAAFEGRITPRVIINVPPGSSKSTIISVMFQAWVWGPCGQPGRRFVSSSYEMKNVTRDTRKTRDLILSEWYQALWPTPLKRQGETSFENFNFGFREGVPFKSLTGKRGDCLLGHTIIETDAGPKRIDDIVNSSISCNVASYDIHSGRVVYRPVEAVARRSSTHFYRLHFADGSVVEATGDHRVYTRERGYVEARLLAEGDSFVRLVRKADCEGHVRNPEGKGAGGRGAVLLQQPVPHVSCEREGREGMPLQGMRHPHTQGAGLLHTAMQGGHDSQSKGGDPRQVPAVASVHDLQHHVSAEDGRRDGEVLLSPMCISRSFEKNARPRQSELARWGECAEIQEPVFETVPSSPTDDPDKGPASVRRLHIDRKAARPSHRHGPGEQYLEKPCNALPVLSRPDTFESAMGTRSEQLVMVERVCESAVVYDLQVAETHCFFANGILVHNCLTIDDPHSLDGAESEVERDKAVRLFIEGGQNRINDWENSLIIIVMQRLHEADLTGAILARDMGYIHLCLPMEFEPERKCLILDKSGAIFFEDPRTFDGELLAPKQFPRDLVEAFKRDNDYAHASQNQQRPVPREGGMFKIGQIQIADSIPANAKWVRGWDIAGSTKTKSPFTVGALLAYADGIVYIADVRRERKEIDQAERLIVDTVREDHARLGTRCLNSLPQDPGQAGKAQRHHLANRLAGTNFKFSPESGTKEDRAIPFASMVNAGNVRMIKAGWNQPLLDELGLFPGSAYKDQVDALSRAFMELQPFIGDDTPVIAAPIYGYNLIEKYR